MILYGPPGTGKTYNTVNYAVSIVEKKQIDNVVEEAKENRQAVFNRYKEYLSGNICSLEYFRGTTTLFESVTTPNFPASLAK